MRSAGYVRFEGNGEVNTENHAAQQEQIPRQIHYCWYGGSPLSSLSQRCLQTWRDIMPGYEIRRWDENALDLNSPYVAAAYKLKKFAFVADYMRLRILYDIGGIYLDTDIEAVQSMDELLPLSLFFGLQSPGSVGVSVIGGAKGHPFLRLLMEALDKEAMTGKLTFQPLPELVTELVASRGHQDLNIFPEDYFYPYNPYSEVTLRKKPLQCNISAKTYCIHHWEGTWLGDMSLRMMVGLRLKNALRKASLRFQHLSA